MLPIVRDRIQVLKAPFAGEATEFIKTQWRAGALSWTEKGVVFLSESDRATRLTRTWIIDAPGAAPRKWQERRSADRYADPGSPVSRTGGGGGGPIMQVGDTIFLSGNGASKDGDRPFLDRLNLKTLTSERVFLLSATVYLPPGYQAGTRLPFVLWAYPAEFTDADTSASRTNNGRSGTCRRCTPVCRRSTTPTRSTNPSC